MTEYTAETEPITVVSYDPSWPDEYQRERAAIFAAIGDTLAAIEHIGSTAVPGLGAKPIIDIMVGIHKLGDVESCVPRLAALGYEYKGEFGIPGRHYFRKPVGLPRTHQIHMVMRDNEFWDRHLLFRNYLRANPDEARAYHQLKLRLAQEHRLDREGYTEAKSEFIEGCLARATAS